MALGQSGKVLIFAVTNRQRSPAAPQVPTAGEAGFPDVVAEGFPGFLRLARHAGGVARPYRRRRARGRTRDAAERLVGLGQVVRVGTTADFLAMIKDQRSRVSAVVKAGGVKPNP